MLFNNAYHFGLTVIFLPFALAILYFFAKDDPILPPLLTWGLGVLPVTALQMQRPIYPLRWQDLTAPSTITVEQGRVLTFLKSPEGTRVAFVIGLISTALMALAVFWGRLRPSPWYFTEGYQAYSWAKQIALSALWGICGGGLTILALVPAHVAISSRYALRHWAWIQTRYPPWPLATVRQAFTYGLGVRYDRAHPSADPSPYVRAITWRQAVATTCFLIGPYFVLFGSTELGRVLFNPKGFRLKVVLWLSVVPGFGAALIALGRYLWSRDPKAPRIPRRPFGL